MPFVKKIKIEKRYKTQKERLQEREDGGRNEGKKKTQINNPPPHHQKKKKIQVHRFLFILTYMSIVGRDSSVGVATRYGLDGLGTEHR